MRDAYEGIFHRILELGRKSGGLRVVDVKIETYALMSLATAVAGWYRPDGRLSVDQIADIYSDLVLEGLRRRKAG
jgi:Tetracyclin repressor-like, C-terminal domain